MAKIPSFRMVGGKSRIRKWIVDHFPRTINGWYFEPFAGKGNVFYEYRSRPDCQVCKAHLNDLNVRFFQALTRFDLDNLPDEVTKETFKDWHEKADSGDPVAIVIEPRITFGGKGYAAGFSGSSGTHVGYNRYLYRQNCAAARILLNTGHVIITGLAWDKFKWKILGKDDFVYLDPPYFGTNNPYGNIDHAALVKMLNRAKFRWALSGYDNPEYEKLKHVVEKHQMERNSEIKSSNHHRRMPVVETLWTNYQTPVGLAAELMAKDET